MEIISKLCFKPCWAIFDIQSESSSSSGFWNSAQNFLKCNLCWFYGQITFDILHLLIQLIDLDESFLEQCLSFSKVPVPWASSYSHSITTKIILVPMSYIPF